MCAIVDANVVGEVFGVNLEPAAKGFFDWLNTGGGKLVVGGGLKRELYSGSSDFKAWAVGATLAGRMREVNDKMVEDRTQQVENRSACKSNDPHVLALAQVSGSRLLYSNDKDLQSDFKNKTLINKPRGKVYSTQKSKAFTLQRKKQLVTRSTLCRFDQ